MLKWGPGNGGLRKLLRECEKGVLMAARSRTPFQGEYPPEKNPKHGSITRQKNLKNGYIFQEQSLNMGTFSYQSDP